MKTARTPLKLSIALAVLLLSPNGLRAAEPPARVMLIGDSMMRVPAHATELQLRRRGGVESTAYTSLGSGLARLDVFDWLAKAEELVEAFQPDVTLAWFGANDHQPLQRDGVVLQPGAPEWAEEYARRIGQLMDIVTAAEGSALLWLELPDMRDPAVQEQVTVINAIIRAEAEKREAVTFFSTRSLLSRRPGTFTMHVPGPTGMPVQVRDPDGVHLSRAGADRIAERLIADLFGNRGNR